MITTQSIHRVDPDSVRFTAAERSISSMQYYSATLLFDNGDTQELTFFTDTRDVDFSPLDDIANRQEKLPSDAFPKELGEIFEVAEIEVKRKSISTGTVVTEIRLIDADHSMHVLKLFHEQK